MDDLQQTLRRAIAEQLKPEKVLARILVQKLRKRGVEKAEQQLRSIEAAAKWMLDNPGAGGRLSWKLQTGNPVLDAEIRQLSLNACHLKERQKKKTTSKIKKA